MPIYGLWVTAMNEQSHEPSEAANSVVISSPSTWQRIKDTWRATARQVRSEYVEKNSWVDLVEDLARRIIVPRYSAPFVMYLLSGVILLGGISIWFEVLRYAIATHAHEINPKLPAADLGNLLTAVHTFYPALAWSSAMQLALSNQASKRLKATSLALGSVVLLLAVAMMVLTEILLPSASLLLGLVGVAIAIFLWWIANALDETYQDTTPDKIGMAAKGGKADPQTPMPGSTNGYDFGDVA